MYYELGILIFHGYIDLKISLTLTFFSVEHQVKHRLICANTLLFLSLRYIQTSVLIVCFYFGLFAKKTT